MGSNFLGELFCFFFDLSVSIFESWALFLAICIYLLHFGAKTCNLLNFAAEFLICTVHRFFPDLNQLFRGFHRVFHGFN